MEDPSTPSNRVRLKKPERGSTTLQKLAAVAWALVLVIPLVAGALVAPAVFYVLVTWFADRATSFVAGLIGARGIALLLGVPMILFAAWGLFRVSQGKSAPNMTPRELKIGVVSMALIGAIGAGALIYAIAGDDAPKASTF
jgi:hypothetical protein